MNHKITIQNLGPIKEIKNFEVKKINAVIGESAVGKSMLAKAIFAFNDMASLNMIFFQGTEISTEKKTKSYLKWFFGSYRDYRIIYDYGNDCTVKLVDNNGEADLKLSSNFQNHINEIKNKMAPMMPPTGKTEDLTKANHLSIQEIVDSSIEKFNIMNSIFIPDTRRFVSDFDNLRLDYISGSKSFLENGMEISDMDMALTSFSMVYRRYLKGFDKLKHPLMRGEVVKIAGNALKFSVNGKVLDFSELSSGQKSLFPLLMMLQEIENRGIPHMIIIEEPENNIFPKDQKLILDRIIEVANKTNSKIFLTTHSPYILMAMNNLIEANTSNYKKLKENNKYIDFNEANIKMLANGKSKNILDKKDKLIDLDYIEKVEDEIIGEFQKMLQASNGKR